MEIYGIQNELVMLEYKGTPKIMNKYGILFNDIRHSDFLFDYDISANEEEDIRIAVENQLSLEIMEDENGNPVYRLEDTNG